MQKKEFVVLFNIEEDEETSIFIPQKVVRGLYNKKKKVFITDDGDILEHIISTDKNIGFAYRNDMSEDMAKDLLDYASSFNYEFSIQEYNGSLIPVITATSKETTDLENSEENINSAFYDRDILSLYLDKGFYDYAKIVYNSGNEIYPEVEEKIIKLEEPNIKQLYQILTSEIQGQNREIKEILGYIWRHYYDNKNNNILVNGNKGVGKTSILKLIEENINIPCTRITVTQNGVNIANVLRELYNKANGDIDEAQKGIIIIDDSENLTTEDSKYFNKHNYVQQDVIALINNGLFDISDDDKEPLYFSTKNLFVIMAGNFSKVRPYTDKKAGITTNDTYEDLKSLNNTNLEDDFFTKFSKVINLKDLTKEDYLTILKSKEGLLEKTKDLYKKNNVTINIDDSTLDYIAEIASISSYGAITINILLERVLSIVTYEVAVNGNKKANVDINVNKNGLLEASIKNPSKCKIRKR